MRTHTGKNISRDPSRTLSRRALLGATHHAGIYDEIIHGHPDAYRGYLSVRVRFGTSAVRVIPVGDETPAESLFRLRCESAMAHLVFNGLSDNGIGRALEELAEAIIRGCAFFEATWRDNVLHLDPVPAHTIDQWIEVDGEAVPMQGNIALDPDRLMQVVPLRSAGPEGIGVLRPLVYIFELWRDATSDIGLRIGKEAGVLILTPRSGASNEETLAAVDSADVLMSGEARVMAHASAGWGHDLLSLPPATSRLDMVEYCDQKIRALMDDTLASLVSSDLGSRALGDALSEQDYKDSENKLEFCVRLFGRELFRQVARGYDYDGRLPVLTSVPASEEDPSDRVDLLARAATLSGWRDTDREELRALLGLLPTDEAGAEIDVSPAPTSLLMARSSEIDNPTDLPDRIVDAAVLIEGRNRDEAQLSKDLWRIAQSLRKKVRAVLSDTERSALEAEYLDPIREIIDTYASRRGAKAARWGEDIVQRSLSNDAVRPSSDPAPLLAQIERVYEAVSKIEAQASTFAAAATRTIFQRVVGEQEARAASGGDVDEPSRITPAGLAEEAGAVGHASEQAGRIRGTQNAASLRGMIVTGAWRVSHEDSVRCDVCTERTSTWHPIASLPTLPDPECRGTAARCRCGLIPGLEAVA